MTGLPRDTPEEIVEELRSAAESDAEICECEPHEIFLAEGALLIEEMTAALREIEAGAPNPVEIATKALNPTAPVLPWGDAEERTPEQTIRDLLKPRRG